MKILKRCVIIAALAIAPLGCANFSADVVEVTPDGTRKESHIGAHTFFDGQSEIAKSSAGQSDKSQHIGVGSIGVSSSGTNMVNLAEIVGKAVLQGAAKAVVP